MKLHTGVYFFVSLALHKKQMKPGLSKLTHKKRLYLSFMIYNGVHKLKSQKWNEVSITDQVILQAVSFDLPRKYREEKDGRRLWSQGMIKLVRLSMASGGGRGLRS